MGIGSPLTEVDGVEIHFTECGSGEFSSLGHYFGTEEVLDTL